MTEKGYYHPKNLFLVKFLSISGALALCSRDCPSYAIGDGWCDISCMNQGCNFDGGDCESYCSDTVGCTIKSNGICDSSCDSDYCGFDHGDCGYCSDGCSLEFLNDYVCHPECNNILCNFNNFTCECNPGCEKSMLGNGICDWACMNYNCLYDSGECWNLSCSPGCTGSLLTNYLCDPECNTASCLYDNGDCLCAPGCSPDLLENSQCDSVCSSESCNYDNHLCGDCAINCFNFMINNGVCNSECNNEACGFDGNDCLSCAPGCLLSEIGYCKPECLVLDCNFDPGCNNYDIIRSSFAAQKFMRDWNYPVNTPNTCYANHGCNLNYYSYTWECDNACNYADCLYDYLQCTTYGCYDVNCPACLAANTKVCTSCWKYQYYTYCVNECPTRYYQSYFYQPLYLKICIPNFDGSTEEMPDESFIGADNMTQGDGTINSPYNSLSYGLSQLIWKYSVVYLMKGEHYLTLVADDDYLFDATALRPLYRGSNKQIQIIVKPLYCSIYNHTSCVDDNDKVTVLVDTNPITLDILTDVTFENIIFDGNTKFSPYCSDCDYCKKIISSGEQITDDHGNILNSSSYVPQSTCDYFNGTNFFEIGSRGILNLKVIFILECGN